MPNFQVRVLGSFASVTQQVDAVRFQMGVSDSVVYQHEDGNREHIHLYMFNAVYKIDKLRSVCRQFFTGNSEFSCKSKAGKGEEITLDGAVRYGSRNGQLHAVNVTGFDVARITELENGYRKTKVAVKETYYQQLIKKFYDNNPELELELLQCMRQPDSTMYSQWEFLKVRAKRFAFDNNDATWSPKTSNDYKSVLITYCMRHGVLMNPLDKISV